MITGYIHESRVGGSVVLQHAMAVTAAISCSAMHDLNVTVAIDIGHEL